jgi:triosephosphate isomerase
MGYTQAKLAEVLELSRMTISRYEAGTWEVPLSVEMALDQLGSAQIPMLGMVAAGAPIEPITQAELVAVLPPFTALRSVQTLVEADKLLIGYGAQDISPHDAGAYTGEISGPMLAKLGCRYALAGHSERRQYHFEDDALVNAKVRAALRAELAAILCIGETLEIREAGDHVAHTLGQLDGALDGLPGDQTGQVIVAYEPVWAIGTGAVATPDDAQEMSAAIRGRLSAVHGHAVAARVRILYGGSVKADNMAAIMTQPDIDGALVGGASLDLKSFSEIVTGSRRPAV